MRVSPDSTLATILPEDGFFEVPTHHHQAVNLLGDGLKAVAWEEDGTIEAVEAGPSELGGFSGFVLGVQWHPEQGSDPRLFTALVEAATGRISGRTVHHRGHGTCAYDLIFCVTLPQSGNSLSCSGAKNVPGGSPAITAAVFRAVRTGNAFEETVERLLEGVKLGVYAPGDRLPPERELTRRLGISRITLREALRELAAAGYVETKRGRFGGTFILRQPEPMVHDELTRTARDMGAQLDDALTFRRVVETGAAEMAARASLSMQQRESLAECLAAMYVCGPSGYRPADTRLHLAIADAAGSPMLTASVVEARVQLVDLLNAIPMLGRNLEHANVQHASIVRAILAGDPDRARRAMEEHVAGTAALLRGFLGEIGVTARVAGG